jgi:hypothetical protein
VGLTDDSTDDIHDLVRDTRQYDRLLPQPGRSNLADQGVTDRTEGGVVDQVEADEENTAVPKAKQFLQYTTIRIHSTVIYGSPRSPGGSRGILESQSADDQEDDVHANETGDV